MERIAGICARNGYNLSRADAGGPSAGARRGFGLWHREAMLNHSCTPNCAWTQIGDFQFTFVTRPVAAGDELCIDYVGECQSYAERRAALQFKCQCPKCELLCSRKDLRGIDAEVAQAFCQRRARAVLAQRPPERWAEIGAVLGSLPPEHQQPLDRVLRLDAALLEAAGQCREAVAAYRRAAAVRHAAMGGAFQAERLADQFAVARCLLGCGDAQAAGRLLGEIYATCWAPFGGLPEQFEALALGKLVQGPQKSLSVQDLLPLVRSAVCAQEQRPPSHECDGSSPSRPHRDRS